MSAIFYSMEITTDAIVSNGFIDPRFTCDSDNSSPELRWRNAPEGVAGFALIAEDPDASAGIFTHWVIYNIPPMIQHLPCGVPPQETLPNGIRQGINGFGKLGYTGPCPPQRSSAHRYVFRLYALGLLPQFESRPRREDLLKVIEPFIITTAVIEGRYQRMVQKAG